MRRILYIVPEVFPTFRVDLNVLFGKWLPQQGIYSDLVACGNSKEGSDAGWGGGNAILGDCNATGLAKHFKAFFHFIRHTIAADSYRYSAIQVRDMPLPALLAIVSAKVKGIKFFYWMSFPMPEAQIALARTRRGRDRFSRWIFAWIRGRMGRFILYRIILKTADHVFVQSERMKEDMICLGANPEKLTPVPMGVDLSMMPSIYRGGTNVKPFGDRRVLIYVGTLDAPRRIEILFQMLQKLAAEVPNTMLLLVGDAHESAHKSWLRRQAEELGVSRRIHWTGWVPIMSAWAYIQMAEVALSPFPRGDLLDSASPTKLIEYMALGIPVVCNDNPDQAQIMNACNAGFCVSYTADAFAKAVKCILEMNEEERIEIGRRGRQYVERNRTYQHLSIGLAATLNREIDKRK